MRGEGLARVVARDVVGFSFAFRELGEEGDLFGDALEGGLALLLEVVEHLLVLSDAVLDAVLVEGEELEVLALGEPDAGLGEGDVDLGVAGGAVGGLADADGVDGAFDGDAAVEGPAVGGDGLDEVGFQAADGGEGLVDAGAVFAVGDLVVGGQDVDLAGEAVAVGVEGAGSRGLEEADAVRRPWLKLSWVVERI